MMDNQLKNVTQIQVNRLSPYVPSISKWTHHYMKQAAGQHNASPSFTKNFRQGKLSTKMISDVESSLDQVESELNEEKMSSADNIKGSKQRSKPVKRKQSSGEKGPKSKKKKVPNDIFS